MSKAPFIMLVLSLLAAIAYCIVISRNVNALNTNLDNIQTALTSTHGELADIKATLTSTQGELADTKEILTSTHGELADTKETLTSTQRKLTNKEFYLNFIQLELIAIESELKSVKEELESVREEYLLYQETLGVNIFYNEQPQIEKAFLSQYVGLTNNSYATNPTWLELKTFLLDDPTDDEIYYESSFDCVDYAEMLHNNAEIAGIKAAFVAILFDGSGPGHTMNAFITSDKGLIYIDCGGPSLTNFLNPPYYYEIEYDKTARVKKGMELGLLSIGQKRVGNPWRYDWIPVGIVESVEIYW
ncbi:hypothetical protein ACFLWD_03180 [Chloroflexota bacterium]